MIELHIGNIITTIEGELQKNVILEIKELCSYSIQGAEFSVYGSEIYCPHCKKQTHNLTTQEKLATPQDGLIYRKCITHGIVNPISIWDGRKCLFDAKNLKFPTGIVSRVVSVLKTFNVEYKVFDERTQPYTRNLNWYGPKLRYYQLDAVDTLLKKSRGIIHASVGCGKTQMLAYLCARTGVNTIVLAHTASVFHQVHKTLSESLRMPIGKVGDGECDIKPITVAMPQSIIGRDKQPRKKFVNGRWKDGFISIPKIKDKFKELIQNTEALFVDEGHHIPCETVQTLANSCVNAYFRVGVTATPYRADNLDMLLEAVTGKIGYKYTSSQAITDKYLAQPTIHFVQFKQSPFPKTIIKKSVEKGTGLTVSKEVKATYNDLYDARVVNNKERNWLIAKIAAHHYRKGESTLIIVRRIDHGVNLYNILKQLGDDVVWVNGDDDTEKLNKVLQDLNDGTCKLCIASGIFNEGIDVRGLNVCINTTACDSPVTAMQILGRTLRRTANKTRVDFYDIADTGVRWLAPHSKSRLKMYETEPKFIISIEESTEYL